MARLAEVALIVIGVAPEPVRSVSARFIQIKDLDPAHRSLVEGEAPTVNRAIPVRTGDVLVASRGHGVAAVQADEDLIGAYATPDVYLVRPDPKRVDAAYLAAFLNRPATARQLRAAKTGAMLPRVPKEGLLDLIVPLPPTERQRKIGDLASAIARHLDLSAKLAEAEARLLDSLLDRTFTTNPEEIR